MKRRPRRGLPATLIAVVLIAAATVVTVVAVQMIIGERPWVEFGTVAAWLHGMRWRDVAVAVAGAVVCVVGAVLVLCAVLPGRLTVVPLRGDAPGTDSGASRRSLRATLRVAASTVDGVRAARLVLRGRRITITVHTNRTNTAGLADAVRAAVDRRLEQIAPVDFPPRRVRVRGRRETS